MTRYVSNNLCVTCSNKRSSSWMKSRQLKNPPKIVLFTPLVKPVYLPRNLDKTRIVNKRWRERNPDKAKLSEENWRRNNYGKALALRAAYRARKLQALPKWTDLNKIRAIYEEAVKLGMTVDHVFPLQGKDVCGLHVHQNLQFLTRQENSAKGNRPLFSS